MENKLEQLFYVALGGALAAKEQIEKNSEELKEWQGKAENTARTFLDDLAEKGAEERESLRQTLKGLLKEVIDELGLATKEDLEQLKKELGDR
nr:hypothetical protein [uncultured Desulfuromonas sp.]